MLDTVESNTDYISVWNDILVPKFNRFRRILMDGLSFHSQVALKQITLPADGRVLDVGCGWGDTALQLARKVGPQGRVVGLDCCDSFLQKGRDDAKSAGLKNLEFLCADVQTHPFKPEYDLCFSRFGMMFFASPVVAMRNIRKALKPGAELMFIVWRRIEDNPWLGIPKQIALQFLPPPGEDAKTCGPGPFSMGSQDVVTAQLKAAGYTNAARSSRRCVRNSRASKRTARSPWIRVRGRSGRGIPSAGENWWLALISLCLPEAFGSGGSAERHGSQGGGIREAGGGDL